MVGISAHLEIFGTFPLELSYPTEPTSFLCPQLIVIKSNDDDDDLIIPRPPVLPMETGSTRDLTG